MQEILATIKALNRKIDQIGEATELMRLARQTEYSTSAKVVSQPDISEPIQHPMSSFHVPQQNIGEVQRVLSWPAVEQLLQCELDELHLWDASLSPEVWLAKIADDFGHPLVLEGRIDIVCENTSSHSEMPRAVFLDKRSIQELCGAFFASFHCLYPILDQSYFEHTLLPQIIGTSFSESDEASALVLLVLALGSVAQQGSVGLPVIETTDGRPMGVKGGSVDCPPGLVFLYEALRRMGVHLSACSLTMLQSYILAAFVHSPVESVADAKVYIEYTMPNALETW